MRSRRSGQNGAVSCAVRSNVWLSIDWDYFVREREEWEFGHAENADFRQLLWNMRVKLFQQKGKDLMKETSLDFADPRPSEFWKSLKGLGFSFRKLRAIVVGDSHRWAFDVFKRSNGSGPPLQETTLVHFDAHHDLVYNVAKFQKEAEDLTVTCENWLLMTHLTQKGLKSLIVYPPWKGMSEWNDTMGVGCKLVPALKPVLSAFTKPCVWPNSHVGKAAGNVEVVYICRSSPWTPPWHDQAFSRFVRELSKMTKVPIDKPFIEVEGVDPMERRRFNRKLEPLESEKLYLARLLSHA